MKFNLRNAFREPMEISVEFEQGLSDVELRDFRKAVDCYRKGDDLQEKEYKKADQIIAGKSDDIDKIGEELEGENE